MTSSRRTRVVAILGAVVLGLAAAITVIVTRGKPAEMPAPVVETAGSILIITNPNNPHSEYYAEILRAEGVTTFRTVDVNAVNATELDDVAIALLGHMEVPQAVAEALTAWVDGGGSLVAFRPDPKLAPLLGLRPESGTLADGYLKVDTSEPPGRGITGQTIQFHGAADRYSTLGGTRALATLFSDATTSTPFPAVTIRAGIGGRSMGMAVAFTYDLARSIVRTRQGNPDWAGTDRDGLPPMRPDDLFFGGSNPDYVDLSKAEIPQADEQQRLLANILIRGARDDTVLPRTWYFPKGAKAVLILAVDDHAPDDRARTALSHQESESPQGCSDVDWECVRSTSLMYTNGNLTDAELAGYHSRGFDFGVHVSTDCRNWTEDSLTAAYEHDIAEFKRKYPSLPPQVANRLHCVAWSDYDSAVRIGLRFGLRLDLDYYYWPGSWVKDRPGFFTGSGIPMRFADLDGKLIDVYQAPSHLVNESGMDYPAAIDRQLDRALGPLGYYGAFGTHYDYSDVFDTELIASAKVRGVPMVSAAQMLAWLDARNASTFTAGIWTGQTLSFTATVDTRARQLLRGMVPIDTGHGTLTSLSHDGTALPFSTEVIKGIRYAVFTTTTGSYSGEYVVDSTPPILSTTSPLSGSEIDATTGVTASFTEPLATMTVNSGSVRLLDPQHRPVPITVTCAPDGTSVTVIPEGPLTPAEEFRLEFSDSITDLAGNPLATVATPPVFISAQARASLWAPDAVNPQVAADDLSRVEVGLRFRVNTGGLASGIWFYKGADQVGQHTATLWGPEGQPLAIATTTTETAAGWQHAKFSAPMALKAGRIYTASYLAPRGHYAFIPDGLATSFTRSGLTAEARGGVYRYGGGYPKDASGTPNYLVDLSFKPA